MPLRLHTAGAVIPTTQRPNRDWIERLPDGVGVRVVKDSQAIRIEGCDPDANLDGLPTLARDYANQALDLMAIRSIGSYALADQALPFICWSGVSEITIRIVTQAQATFSMTVGGPPNPPSAVWHESMRYFRMSQTTTDLFDAFRNLYLALESILSTIAPVLLRANGRPAESESVWTKRALGEAARILQAHNSSMTFDRYLDSPSAGDAIDEVFSDLYQATRTAIFHAKNGRVFALPQNQRDRQQVACALARYVLRYTDLAEPVLGVRFLRSGIAAEGFAAIADGLLPQSNFGAVNGQTPISAASNAGTTSSRQDSSRAAASLSDAAFCSRTGS